MMRNRLKELRSDYDLTQREVAQAIGITQRKYSYMETGMQLVTEEIINKLADFYCVNTDYLLGRTDYPHPLPKSRRCPTE